MLTPISARDIRLCYRAAMRRGAILLLLVAILSGGASGPAAVVPPDTTTRAGAPSETLPPAFEELIRAYLASVRMRLAAQLHAAPAAPREIAAAARRLAGSVAGVGWMKALVWFLALVGSGLGLETLFRRATRARRRNLAADALASAPDRAAIMLLRLAYELFGLLMFAAGSIGGFLLFDWPPLLGSLLLEGSIAVLLVRLALTVARFALAPEAERFRLLPIDTPTARRWQRWTGILAGIAATGWATTAILAQVGTPEATVALVGRTFGLILLCVALRVTWFGWQLRRPRAAESEFEARSHAGALLPVAVTILLPLVGLLFLAGAHAVAWSLVIIAGLPVAMMLARRAIGHVLRPADLAAAVAASPPHPRDLMIERGVRAILVVIAALFLAHAFDLDLSAVAAGNTAWSRASQGVLEVVIVLLIADLAWQFAKIAIDRKLTRVDVPADGLSAEDARRHARLRTLLPILRNIVLVALIAMASLMVLAAMGVQIGPLLAGAGVVGVAVGFGAQALVKDIIAGIFFLLDDAFRVGEYIASGNVKGTVESFSLRSVRLRHHRGPLLTVPFGDMREITNFSRDWVIEKLDIAVSYDTDLDRLKRAIKAVSAELMTDDELAAAIVAPLKSQGVYRMGDFGIQIRLKVTTKPNEQFLVRRAIYARVKAAFDADGIKFAIPTIALAIPEGAAAARLASAARPQAQDDQIEVAAN